MRQPFSFVPVAACLLFLLAFSTADLYGQSDARSQAETSFEVTLSVVAGSNDPAQKTELPSSLAGIAKQLRGSFGLTSLRLADTYIGRIGNNGSIQYKSLADIDGRAQTDTPSFLDWQISGLRNMAGAGGANMFYIQSFRFGTRVPVRVSGNVDAAGKTSSSIQYESIGLNVERMTVGENTPVLIGTIALPKADGSRVFLVLNVSPAGN